MNGRTNERTNSRTNERTDGRTVQFYYAPNFTWGHKKAQEDHDGRGYSTAHNQIELISGSSAVALRFRYKIVSLFYHVLRYLRTMNIVRILLRCRINRHLIRIRTIYLSILNIAKHYKTVWYGYSTGFK